jgi:hypothetical protein
MPPGDRHIRILVSTMIILHSDKRVGLLRAGINPFTSTSTTQAHSRFWRDDSSVNNGIKTCVSLSPELS